MSTISVKIELLKPTQEKIAMYKKMTTINTQFANWLLGEPDLKKATSAVFKRFMPGQKFPSAVSNQTIRDAKSQLKNQSVKVFKRLWCTFNNQNFKFEQENGLYKVSFPTLEKRIGVPLRVSDYQKNHLDKILAGVVKAGTVKLIEKKNRWFVVVSIQSSVQQSTNTRTMGIDVGLKNVATCMIGTKSLFFGGNQLATKRRKFSARRRRLGKAKKLNAIRKSKDKEARWMRNENHRISKQIIRYAIANGVGVVRMEDLTGIRMAKSQKEAGRNLNNWGFYQLQSFIEYKAQKSGLIVEYVNPKYTSQTCKCGHKDKNNRNSIVFKCVECGYTNHADVNAGINIPKAISGLSKKKKAA